MDLCYRYKAKDNVILFLKSSKDQGLFTEYIEDKSIANLESDISNVYYYINDYGIDSMGGEVSQEQLMARFEYFIEKVYEGFRLAQEKIIETLQNINLESKSLKIQLKQARIDRDRDLVNKFRLRLQELSNREYIFRKLVDTIAWGYIFRHHYIARRLYIGRNIDSIQNSDIETYLEIARTFTEKNKLSFSLLTDITSFIQLGDVIYLEANIANHTTNWKLLEIKSGEKNHKILNILYNKETISEETISTLTKAEIGQGLRIVEQFKKMHRAISVIKDEKGLDARGDNINVIDAEHVEIAYYDDIVQNMFKSCGKKGWSTKVIDDCLYVGVYDVNIPIKMAYYAFHTWMNEIDIKYPITNFQSTFKYPLFKPPFLTQVGKINLIDVALGKKIILACLDFDKWFDIGSDMGLNCRWLNRRGPDEYFGNNKVLYI